MALNNDFPADAYVVTIGAHPPWVSGPIDCTTYTKAAPEPGVGDPTVFRTSWYRYTPTGSGSATFYASGVVPTNTGTNVAVQVDVFTANTDGSLNPSGAVGGADNHLDPTTGASYTTSVTGYSTYYLRVASYLDTAATVYVNVTGPATDRPDENRISTAVPVNITAANTTWRSAPVADDQLTISSDEPEQNWFRSAFWKLTIPSGTTGTYTFTGTAVASDGSAPSSVYMRIYRQESTGVLNQVGGGFVGSPVTVDSAGLSILVIEIANTAQENARWTYRLTVTGPATTGTGNPHQYATAVQVFPDGQNSVDPGLVRVVTGFDATEVAPPGVTLTGYRGYWYTYAPASSSSGVSAQAIAVDDSSANVLPITFTAWQVSGAGVWTQIGTVTGNSGYMSIDPPLTVTANTRIYLRMSSSNPAVARYRMSMSYAPTGGTAPLYSPPVAPPVAVDPITVDIDTQPPLDRLTRSVLDPITVHVSTDAAILGESITEHLDPVTVDVEVQPGSTPAQPLNVPPVVAGARVRAAEIRRLTYGMVEPEDASVLPVNPALLSGYVAYAEGDVSTFEAIQVDFQYGTYVAATNTWTPVGTVSDTDVEILAGYTTAEASTATLDPGKHYAWRMRLVIDGAQRPWTGFRQFTLGDVTTNAAVLPVRATVSSVPTYPHLWHIEPPVGAPGEQVTLVGQGFATNATSVLFGDAELEIIAWTHVPATADAALGTRIIAELDVSCAHDEVVVVVPDTEEPGASVVITGGI